MLRTYVFFISLFLCLNFCLIQVKGQDTIRVPLKIKIGIEASGPALYYSDKNVLNAEGYLSIDLNEKRSAYLGAGFLNYKYSQYNYSYMNKGSFIRIGMDFNLLKPDKSQGKYWTGIGLRYGLSMFNSKIPMIEKTNYWGTATTSIPERTYWGHFLEASPGVRAEILNHFSIGWSVSLRMLLYSSTGNNLKPVYFPGFGDGTKKFTTGISYFLVWNIPYKKINVILKKETPEENEDNSTEENTGTESNQKQGNTIGN